MEHLSTHIGLGIHLYTSALTYFLSSFQNAEIGDEASTVSLMCSSMIILMMTLSDIITKLPRSSLGFRRTALIAFYKITETLLHAKL